ncbi:MAG: hypothetical protein QXH55_02420 [Candidatus Korarchaeota archaeon]|nr:hypothetical protein [Thermoproteota archaeon]MCR8463015.1 hypothetical protein [Thermoproteota archaeon]MCR8470649.1 hypothetical protein [Thermoproteota archaeon]MCR8471617.1 hypothetical protein [Thermoproteota archaeon]MCR8473029.1 hypothetical protein [Thermoproteota archaeon]
MCYQFEFSPQDWDAIKNYPYAGLDFLIDDNQNIVFLEANAVPGGISVMENVCKLILENAPGLRKFMPHTEFVKLFTDAALTYYRIIKGGTPKLVLVTTPYKGDPVLMPERLSIVEEFKRRGVQAVICHRERYTVQDNKILLRAGSRFLCPDLIIRRNTIFPKNVSQPVINKSEVGLITGSKYRTYRIVSDFLSRQKEVALKIPETYFAKSVRKAITISEEILSRGKEVVVKPNKGERGKDIIFIRSASDAETKLKRAFHSKRITLVVQERIQTLPFCREGRQYVFDIRTYAYLGQFVGAHIRRSSVPIGSSSIEDYGVSNISHGGTYVPLLSTSDGPCVIKWRETAKRLYLFKHIIVDNYAFSLPHHMWKMLKRATEFVVRAIGYALNGFLNYAKI